MSNFTQTVAVGELLDIIGAIKTHAAKKDIRYFLNGVAIGESERGEFTAAATDGHRVIVSGGPQSKYSALIPNSRMAAVVAFLRDVKRDSNYMGGQEHIVIEADNFVSFTAIGGESLSVENVLATANYPSISRVFPDVSKWDVVETKADSIDLPKMTAAVAKSKAVVWLDTGETVIRKIGRGMLRDGENAVTAANAAYVIDAIKSGARVFQHNGKEKHSSIIQHNGKEKHSSIIHFTSRGFDGAIMPVHVY